jgi:hypothetical protein
MLPMHPRFQTSLASLCAQFQAAAPFQHIVLDDFLEPAFCDALIAEFPAFNPALARTENGDIGLKAVNERISELGPAYKKLDALLQSARWLSWVSDVTGIPDLRYDPHYFGGGTHDNKHGQDLDPHIDFNRHPLDQSHRRLNLIIYLNEGWQPEWGGQLQLHTDPRAPENKITQINPSKNRCVIFETTESSWHAFDRICLPTELQQRTRRSIAIYLYTKTRPAELTGATHSTIYVDLPLPAHLKTGHMLSQQDVEALHILTARRDMHIQRLYRDITDLTKQLDGAKAALGMSRLRRIWWMFRRALGRR